MIVCFTTGQFVDLITGLQGPPTRESRQVKGTDYQEVAQLREALSNLQIENKQLREHNLGGGESGDDSKVKMALARSQRDLVCYSTTFFCSHIY